jgi:hypothetical protein
MWRVVNVTVLGLLAITAMSQQAPVGKIRMLKDSKSMKAEILKHIPLGTAVEDAQKKMEENSFKCALKQNRSFAETEDDGSQRIHEKCDYLYCDLELPITEYCRRRYQIAMVHDSGIVVEIRVSIGLVCL